MLELNLSYHLTHMWRKINGFMALIIEFLRTRTQQTRLEFKIGWMIPFSAPITITLTKRLYKPLRRGNSACERIKQWGMCFILNRYFP